MNIFFIIFYKTFENLLKYMYRRLVENKIYLFEISKILVISTYKHIITKLYSFFSF